MTDLLAARAQMALSLGFHIVFAAVGIAMPFLMSIAHHRYLKTRRPEFRVLTKAWSKTVAIFFAVGAVSGTALSFELGLLWPGFMIHAGPIIGMPFSWEGAAFFLEAIFIGIFLYGWKRLPERSHWLSGIMVGLSGVASGFFVICANGWMNSPAGFDWNNGHPINIDPWAAMFNDAALGQGVHMIIASFQAVGFAFAGVHALLYLRLQHPVHREAMKIAFLVGAVAAIIQPISGDLAAKSVAVRQPIKLAAMEGHFETEKGAPLLIGGLPNVEARRTDYALPLPKALSFLAFGDFDAEVKGLNEFPRNLWPPVVVTHVAFQIMVGIGTLMALVGALGIFWLWKKPQNFLKPLWLKGLVAISPLGLIAIEAGWVVTEVGRQPWVIYGYLKTADALTPRPGIIFTLILYLVIYLALTLVVYHLVRRQITTLQQDLGQVQDKGDLGMSMVDVVLIFLGVAIVFYVLFGGADLGAGIMELFLSKDSREDERALISHAMAPVWEANHVWLILAVVILFMGFPRVYTEGSTYLHIPLMAVLVGIVARGCAFTFRYYDTERTYRRMYTRIFAYSSLWTAFFLGVLGGSSVAGLINPNAGTYAEFFLDPWLNPFCIGLGLFTASFCTMLANIFLVGEADEIELTRILRRKAKIALLVTSIIAPLPLAMAELMGRPIMEMILLHPISLGFFALAILLVPLVWISLNRSIWTTWARAFSVVLVGSIILSWFMAQYPTALYYSPDSHQRSLTFYEAAAPAATLRVLIGGLVVGSLCIFPALAYLFKIFKWDTLDEERRYRP